MAKVKRKLAMCQDSRNELIKNSQFSEWVNIIKYEISSLEEFKWLISDYWSDSWKLKRIANEFMDHGICSNIERPDSFTYSFYDEFES